jgi:hypothetical protein
MAQGTELKDQDLRSQLRLVSVLFLIAGSVFLALIFNQPLFGYFDASRTYDEAVAYVQDNLTALRWMFTGVGVTDLMLGASLWLWGNHLRRSFSGGEANAAWFAAWAGLWGGLAALAGRLSTAWFLSVEDLAYTSEVSFDVMGIIFLTGMLAWTIAFVIFGVLIIRGPMPTWLGVVLIACGVLPMIGAIPAWYYLGAIVLGITLLVRLRRGKPVLSTSSPR